MDLMPDALAVYLNDHLAGSAFGEDLAKELATDHQDKPFGAELQRIAEQISEDKRSLELLLEQLDITPSTLKELTGWVGEKLSKLKLATGAESSTHVRRLLSIETLCIGVNGKRMLWRNLKEVEGIHPALKAAGLDGLRERAESQLESLERIRLEIARNVLGSDSAV